MTCNFQDVSCSDTDLNRLHHDDIFTHRIIFCIIPSTIKFNMPPNCSLNKPVMYEGVECALIENVVYSFNCTWLQPTTHCFYNLCTRDILYLKKKIPSMYQWMYVSHNQHSTPATVLPSTLSFIKSSYTNLNVFTFSTNNSYNNLQISTDSQTSNLQPHNQTSHFPTLPIVQIPLSIYNHITTLLGNRDNDAYLTKTYTSWIQLKNRFYVPIRYEPDSDDTKNFIYMCRILPYAWYKNMLCKFKLQTLDSIITYPNIIEINGIQYILHHEGCVVKGF